MREILFRAKLKSDNGIHKKGEWVYGHYCELIDGKKAIPYIYGNGEVNKNTIGQYTGLTDKNGTKIFEGDIVDYDYFGERKIGKIFFNDCGYEIENQGCFLCVQSADKQLDCEVIGNIHDNPELLKGGAAE